MHESLRYLLEKVLSTYTEGDYYQSLLKAKEDYFLKTGKAFEEDEDYESRMASFNDWYVLQYQPDESGKSFFEQYISGHEVLPELVEAIEKTNHSLFEYTGTSFRGQHVLKDILHDSKVTLAKNHSAPSMVKGDIFIGRTTFFKEENYLFNGLRMMPKEARSAMKKEARKVRKLNDKAQELDYLFFTESLKTKWQRYGHVDVNKIFVFPDNRVKSK
jgi:hypothetical protein